MSLDGIINSPNGQPAMYEYRIADSENPEVYGKIDKPQFLWAAGWYLYSLYHLMGFHENVWNISLTPPFHKSGENSVYTIFFKGQPVRINLHGSSQYISSIRYNDRMYPSAVIPREFTKLEKVEIFGGNPEKPYILNTESILESCSYNHDELKMILNAYPEHPNRTVIISPFEPESLFLNNLNYTEIMDYKNGKDIYRIDFQFKHRTNQDTVRITFSR